MNPDLSDRIDRLPTRPGVYVMRGHDGQILYIGKATDLRSRVKSYFTGQDPRPFVRYLDKLLADIEVTITSNPKEALLLENTLIKKHKPRFNVMLRDDKNYLSLRIDPRADWPRVELVRRIREDGASYYGPYHSAQSARRTLNVLNRFFRLRTCPDSVLRNRSRPCLQHQIKRCPGPCVLPVDRDAYLDDVRHAMLFLSGRETELIDGLTRRMERAAEQLEFEAAAHYRDQREAVQTSLTKQAAVQTSAVDRDVIGTYREGASVALTIMRYREGQLEAVRSYGLTSIELPDEELISSFVTQLYADANRKPPEDLVVPVELPDADAVADALSELRGTRVRISVPQRGERRALLELATENAQNHHAEEVSTSARTAAALEDLQKRLRLSNAPRTIECYDISNFQGRHVVASQVMMLDGVIEPSRLKRYRIRTVDGQDDFASMFEVLKRRTKRALSGDEPMPDLIVIDGGRGQLNMAVAALAELGVDEQDVVSLAKSRITGRTDDEDVTRSPERVFVPGVRDAIVLKQTSDACYLLQRIRDEAHRVAITYHRELRRKSTLRSSLDDIPGIGPGRRRALFKHLGSVKRIRAATLEEIEATPGLGRAAAWSVYDWFHPGEADPPSDG